MVFNDEQKNDIAWQEYTKYKVGNKVKLIQIIRKNNRLCF